MLLTALSAGVQSSAFAQNPADMVGALHGTFGKHDGMRPSHAKGFCVEGEFIGNPSDASKITSAVYFNSTKKYKVLARFSIGGGNPKASDKGKTVRGFAMRFDPGSKSPMDLSMLSAPVFFVKDPKDFIGFLEARKPDPATGKPNPEKVKAFNESHPDTKPQIEFLSKTPVPTSYGTIKYYSVNAFEFTNKEKSIFGRWIAEPFAKGKEFTEEELNKLPDDFLQKEFVDRLQKEKKVEFDLWVQIAEKEDDVIDPTVAWPEERKKVKLGTVSLKKMAKPTSCNLMFNPIALPEGIKPSDDPILKARLPAYVISLGERTKSASSNKK